MKMPKIFTDLEDLLEERIAINKFLLMLVLQLVRLDVLPEGRNDNWPGDRITLYA